MAGARNFDRMAVGSLCIPPFEVWVDGSVCSSDQHPARLASPGRFGDDRLEVDGCVQYLRPRHECGLFLREIRCEVLMKLRRIEVREPVCRFFDRVRLGKVKGLVIGQEGDVKATTSIFTQLRASFSLIGPSRAVTDSTVDKTAWSRAGEGNKGFGMIGAGGAQASAATATGFGYFGAAVKIYDPFLAKGSNVELPANTPIYLRVDE